MTDSETIDVGEIDGYVWVQVNGKGSFTGSPLLKSYVEGRMAQGERRFVVDLVDCPAMDSTFMGTLAGLAMKLSRVSDGHLELSGVSDRNRRSLEDLGLGTLLDINPADTEWLDHVAQVRASLEPLEDEPGRSDPEHVLEAHRQLCEVNDENVRKFATVLDVLEKDATRS